jgi:hypothetical protein
MSPIRGLVLALFVSGSFAATLSAATITVDTFDPNQGPVTSYYSPQPESPEVHLIGVYQGTSSHISPGAITVHVAPPSNQAMVPMVLVLSSYLPETWTLDVHAGAQISEIVLNGFGGAQTIIGSGAIPVINRSPGVNSLGAYAYAWPSATGGSDTPALVTAVQNLVGSPLTSFTGAYQVSEVSIVGTAVPEPSTLILAALGAIALLAYRRRIAP